MRKEREDGGLPEAFPIRIQLFQEVSIALQPQRDEGLFNDSSHDLLVRVVSPAASGSRARFPRRGVRFLQRDESALQPRQVFRAQALGRGLRELGLSIRATKESFGGFRELRRVALELVVVVVGVSLGVEWVKSMSTSDERRSGT